MITAKQLQKALGVTRRTLSNWQTAGLIVNPVRGQSVSGRGSVGLFPDDTLATGKQIKQHQAAGKTLQEIAVLLANDLSVDIQKVAKHVFALLAKFDAPSPDRDDGTSIRVRLVQGLTHGLSAMLNRDSAERIGRQFGEDEYLGRALHLAWLGYGPVLVVPSHSDPYLTTDFMVSHEIGFRGQYFDSTDEKGQLRPPDEHFRNVDERLSARVVMPLYGYIRVACDLIGVVLPPKRVLAATVLELVEYKRGTTTVDNTVHVDFTLMRSAGGPYGRLMFALRPTTKRIAHVGKDFV